MFVIYNSVIEPMHKDYLISSWECVPLLQHVCFTHTLDGRLHDCMATIDTQPATNPMWVIISTDATRFFRTSATRADVFVDCWGDLTLVSQPSRWATWFVMDGSDDTMAMAAFASQALLNDQIATVQQDLCGTDNNHPLIYIYPL